MLDTLAFVLIVLPFLAGLGCFILRVEAVRSLIVVVTGGIVAAASVALFFEMPFKYEASTLLGLSIDPIIMVLDVALMLVILYFGIKHKSALIIVFALIQAFMGGYLEFGLVDHAAEKTYPLFVGDTLAVVMVLIISIIGSLICVFAIPYMRDHEAHLHLTTSKQPKFFLVLVAFLGAMNGLVLTNDLGHFFFFWEVTTLCSFLLIGHDGTEIATKNAVRALWMNSLGGVALMGAIVWIYSSMGTLEIASIIAAKPTEALMLVPLGLIVFAGLTKSAQMPFQSWLLGAMVAPTPVSALLHSSTMVKAGVYLIVRFAPAYADTHLSTAIALCGAFTFLGTSALAVGQSNGKKILAYSTIANLGLIVACAGINTPLAITAAILLIIFHAVSKGLLFLCVGTVEHGIGSRDVEDMRGVYAKMPVTALITMAGVLTMILPPFGMLLGKWMAIESAAGNVLVIIMLALGSAITVLYWARWAGTLMSSAPGAEVPATEKQDFLTRMPLVVLCLGAVVLSFAAPWIYAQMVVPVLATYGGAHFTIGSGAFQAGTGSFAVIPLFVVALVGFLVAVNALRKARGGKVFPAPYMAGLQIPDKPNTYMGPMITPVQTIASNYYMEAAFGEEKLTRWGNVVAGVLIIGMFAMGGLL